LFQRGRFDVKATALCAEVLGYLLLGAAAFAAQTVVVRGFYARQNTLSPTAWGSVAVVAAIPVFVLGVKFAGPVGLALALVFAVTLQVALLFGLYCRRHAPGQAIPVVAVYAKMALAAALAGMVTAGAKVLVFGEAAAFWPALGLCAAAAAVFVPVLFWAGRLLKVAELDPVWDQLKKRLGVTEKR